MPSLSEILKEKIGKSSETKTYVMSKTQVATELNLGEKTIENYMNGEREPTIVNLVKLSEILGFELNDLARESIAEQPKAINYRLKFEQLVVDVQQSLARATSSDDGTERIAGSPSKRQGKQPRPGKDSKQGRTDSYIVEKKK